MLFAVGAIVLQGEPPAYDASLAEVRQFFSDNSTRFLIGDYLAGLAFLLLFLPFVVGLRSLLGAAEGGPQIASRLMLVGGLATVLIGDTATVFQDTLALGAANPELQDTTLRAFLYANAAAIAAIGLPAAVFTFAASVVIWTTAVLWRWLAVLDVLAGVLLAVGAAFPLAGDPTGPLWTIRFISFIALGGLRGVGSHRHAPACRAGRCDEHAPGQRIASSLASPWLALGQPGDGGWPCQGEALPEAAQRVLRWPRSPVLRCSCGGNSHGRSVGAVPERGPPSVGSPSWRSTGQLLARPAAGQVGAGW